MRKLSHVFAGQLAEADACQFLEKQGLRLLEKNFRVKSGEIDLIMQDQKHLVFVEVKLRTKQTHGSAIEVIPLPKQSRIIRAATLYLLKQKSYHTAACRFDVVGIAPHKQMRDTLEITWIKDAFQVQY